MPALMLEDEDPCDLLSKENYPNLWLDTVKNTGADAPNNESVLNKIFQGGANKGKLQPYTYFLQSESVDKPVLKNPEPTSDYALKQFLSGGGVASKITTGERNTNTEPTNYSLLRNIALGTSSSREGIIDTYIIDSAKGLGKGDAYTYSTDQNKLLSETDFWNPADATNDGGVVNSPTSILGKLIQQGHLLKGREIYVASEFAPVVGSSASPPPAAGQESLIYLYRLSQRGNSVLTKEQLSRKTTLETKNLKFFGAFLCEYCYWRSRYEKLLTLYFNVYSAKPVGSSSTTGTGYSSPNQTLPIFGNDVNTKVTTSPITQQEYLRVIAYHLACLNTRITDLRRLLGKISLYYGNIYTDIQTQINSTDSNVAGSNQDLLNKISALNTSAVTAQKYMADMEFHEGAMAYNAEKNRYANILLGLYAFLNVAAIAAIIQINR